MKKQLIASCALLMVFHLATAQNPFTIKGKLSDIQQPSKMMLTYRKNGQRTVDSALITKGSFMLKGDPGSEPVIATLTVKSLDDDGSWSVQKVRLTDQQDLFLAKGAIKVKGKKMKSATITGGDSQKEFNILHQRTATLDAMMAPLVDSSLKLYAAGKSNEAPGLGVAVREIRSKINAEEEKFVKDFPDSYVSLMLVEERASIIRPASFEPLYTALSARLRNTEKGKKMGDKLAIAKKIDIGQPAIAFTQNNQHGEPVSLASLKGKYVLIDFWASWCGPCRAENPNVLKAYKKFHDKNFEIIAVSLDEKKEPWLAAIEKDGLPWIHVSDLKGWKNEVSVAYGITAVPQSFLLDKEGKVIAKNLRGEELEAKLKQLIGE
ncbi:AhpC/TSA family protein [Pseudoflavitalea sp. G-6-1-2]|uniref:TlpA disulfide reductase family protein n=1 Tax=Pseudoflavitalea sp. G-6-1-2 TaxID=2728841 RepID=UPI00146B69C9|nr:TlpA disulfide reductase family protein [Pseudoflavitalea sp. G-6-1-2]NML22234.1 AhpC/TSA family protein [Pseudoflavitalea sp. G-6-1-2]